MADPPPLDIDTPRGPARAHLRTPDGPPRAALVLGHGAGGGIGAPDLVAVADAARAAGIAVALVEQPYRVAGRRAPERAPALDAAWEAVVAALRDGPLAGVPLIAGGRSSGARVACRTAAATAARGVVCLAFPLRPPARAGRPAPPDRLGELDAVRVPALVVQGRGDRFGMPPPAPGRTVVEVDGDHALRRGTRRIGAIVVDWIAGLPAG